MSNMLEVVFAKSHYKRTPFSDATIVPLQIWNIKKFEIVAQ